MPLTREQCRASRALLGWSQGELAERSGVGKQTVADFERGARLPYDRTLRDLRDALEGAGVMILDADETGGPGARLERGETR